MHNHFPLGMHHCFTVVVFWVFFSFPTVIIIGSQNNPRVQGHPGIPDGGRGGGVYGRLDHIHKEPGTRSVRMQL